MPTVEDNQRVWNSDYHWAASGEEWSSAWGDSSAQWFGTILPRIHSHLPAATIVEIAPGRGRWSQYLIPDCKEYMGYDLSASCVSACKTRFAAQSHASFFQTAGKELHSTADESVDFVFSFDSLVHAEMDVMQAYMAEIFRVLRPGGTAFVHHSNAASYPVYFGMFGRLPGYRRLTQVLPLEYSNWRGLSVSGDKVIAAARKVGMRALVQERINWNSTRLLDCMTTLAKAGHPEKSDCVVYNNPGFMSEAAAVRRMSTAYSVARTHAK
jgi:ubiquinone/menaquinone biosynthesis C-methylase UbiE